MQQGGGPLAVGCLDCVSLSCCHELAVGFTVACRIIKGSIHCLNGQPASHVAGDRRQLSLGYVPMQQVHRYSNDL